MLSLLSIEPEEAWVEEEVDKNTFSLNSLLNQVLKPLDVKTKFYNAEVSLAVFFFLSSDVFSACLNSASP